jgi:hypothetical protein
MASKLASLMAEVSALETAVTKTAAAKPQTDADRQLANVLDKLAMDLGGLIPNEKKEDKDEDKEEKEEKGEKKEDEDEKKEKDSKEASMNENALVDKIATRVLQALEKIAVQNGEPVNGMPSATAGSDLDSSSVLLSAIGETQEAKRVEGTSIKDNLTKLDNDLVKSETPGIAEPEPVQKKGSVVYTGEEAEVLSKLASVGYEYLVDYYSDQIVNQKIAEAVTAERAKTATQKIAQAIVAKENGTQVQAQPMTAREKLASAAQQDPNVLSALQVLHAKGLL